jgi:hypothetical protein
VSNWQEQIAVDRHEIDDLRNQAIPNAEWNQQTTRWQTRAGSPDRADAQTQINTFNAKLEALDTEIADLRGKIQRAGEVIFVYGSTEQGEPITVYSQNAVTADLASSMEPGNTYRVFGAPSHENGVLKISLINAFQVDAPQDSGKTSANGASSGPMEGLPDSLAAMSAPNACFSAKELSQCSVTSDGTITAGPEGATLHLQGTEGMDFRLTGEIFTGQESKSVLFWFRKESSLHVYDLDASGMRVKRLLLAGQMVRKFAYPIRLHLPVGQWIPVRIDVRQSAISATFGDQSGTAEGPLTTDGQNSIALMPGGRVRNIRVAIEQPAIVKDKN